MLRYLMIATVLCMSKIAHAKSIDLTVLHTNDLHSQFEGTGPDGLYTAARDEDPVRGGYARISAQIRAIRSECHSRNEAVLLLDGGDFFAGSLLHAVGISPSSSETPELEFFQHAGYDAITLGNHEFDAGWPALRGMLEKGARKGFNTPLVVSNRAGQPLGSELMKPYLVRNLTSGGVPVRVVIAGFFPADAARLSAVSRKSDITFTSFNDEASSAAPKQFHRQAREFVDGIILREKPDLFISLFHGGQDEVAEFIKAVPRVDLVIGGHTHLVEHSFIGSTIYAQAGFGGRQLGTLQLRLDTESKQLSLRNEETPLVSIDDGSPFDSSFQERIEVFKTQLPQIMGRTQWEYHSPVFTPVRAESPRMQSRDPFSRRMASLLLEEIRKKTDSPVMVYLSVKGMVREGLTVANSRPTLLQFSDIFRILGIGFDDEFRPGSPLLGFHLSRADLRLFLEFFEFYGQFNPVAFPVVSNNLQYEIRSWGVPLWNRIRGATLDGRPQDEWPELIPVAMNTYVFGFFPRIRAMTKGLVDIIPRDAQGNPLEHPPRLVPAKEFELLAEALHQSVKEP